MQSSLEPIKKKDELYNNIQRLNDSIGRISNTLNNKTNKPVKNIEEHKVEFDTKSSLQILNGRIKEFCNKPTLSVAEIDEMILTEIEKEAMDKKSIKDIEEEVVQSTTKKTIDEIEKNKTPGQETIFPKLNDTFGEVNLSNNNNNNNNNNLSLSDDVLPPPPLTNEKLNTGKQNLNIKENNGLESNYTSTENIISTINWDNVLKNTVGDLHLSSSPVDQGIVDADYPKSNPSKLPPVPHPKKINDDPINKIKPRVLIEEKCSEESKKNDDLKNLLNDLQKNIN